MHPTENINVTTHLRNLIFYSLDNDLLQNAVFHAGRLHGWEPRSGDAAHLLALCHFRLGQYKAAYDYSREKGLRGLHLGCAYIFAQSCLVLQKYNEGTNALERAQGLWLNRSNFGKHTDNTRKHLPDAPAAYFLLGKLWFAYGDVNRAVENFVSCLRINPFLWDAFVELCNTGMIMKAANVFKLTSELLAGLENQPSTINSAVESIPQTRALQVTKVNGNTTPGTDPFNTKMKAMNMIHTDSELNGINEWETPVSNVIQADSDIAMEEMQSGDEAPPAPNRKASRSLYSFQSDAVGEIPRMRSITTRSKTKAGSDTSEASDARPTSIPISHKRTISGQPAPEANGATNRRSDRLLRNRILPSSTSRIAASAGAASSISRESDLGDKISKRDIIKKSRVPGTKSKSTCTVSRIMSGTRKPLEATENKDQRSVSASNIIRKDISLPKEALVFLLDQYGKLAQGYYALSQYDSSSSIRSFESLLPQFRDTPWVLAQMGRAYFEKASYIEADEKFTKVKKSVPSRTEDMEIFSTVLWHLKKDVDLSYLSHGLIEMDRLSPQAWCALGNAFSLQGEHEQAVKCFRRATQLDPKFAYAYTLSGHEYVANEEFDKALMAYRNAISADQRHYNGWYGLGQVFEKLGKYEIALDHYQNAAAINSGNPLLKVCVGLVLEKMALNNLSDAHRYNEMALQMYSEASALDGRSHKARFNKARLLLALGKLRESRIELEELKNMIPDNARVHFKLGEIYARFRDKTNAIRHYTIAMNLDPKSANTCNAALLTLGDDDDDDDDEDME